MSRTFIDQAVQFLTEYRWPVLPSTGSRKGPCVRWKAFQERLPTVDELLDWDRQYRPKRWGVVTGRLAGNIVADFDGEQGRELVRKWGIKPHRRTGSGGLHLHVEHPGWRVPTLNAKSSRLVWPWHGLDIRGDGGFAVLIGRNKSGPYVQLRELVPEPFDALPKEVRDFLRDHSGRSETQLRPDRPDSPYAMARDFVGSDRVTGMALEIASRDGRNNAGFWLACQLRDNRYGMAEAEAAMRQYCSWVGSVNTKGEREAYTAREAIASLRQAYSQPARQPWTKANPNAPIADGPGSLCIYVGHTGEPLVGHTGEPLSPAAQYSRVPRDVCGDRRLKSLDIRVYAVLAAHCWQGNVSQVGKRLIATEAPCSERLVIDSIRRLEAAGHIQKVPGLCRGQRGRYLLLSPVFAKKQRAGVQEIATGPGGRLRLVSVRKDRGTAA